MPVKSYADFKAHIDAIIKNVEGRITNESPKEDIQAVADIKTQLETACKDYEDLTKDNQDIKDMLISSMKKEGSKDAPIEEHANDDKPKTMLEIAQGLTEKNK